MPMRFDNSAVMLMALNGNLLSLGFHRGIMFRRGDVFKRAGSVEMIPGEVIYKRNLYEDISNCE